MTQKICAYIHKKKRVSVTIFFASRINLLILSIKRALCASVRKVLLSYDDINEFKYKISER